jgi:L-fuconolactonase
MVTEADWNKWTPENIRPYLDIVVEAFGPERILIGSDWPVCLVAGKYGEVMQVVIDHISSLSEKEQALILGENAAKAYRIPLTPFD